MDEDIDLFQLATRMWHGKWIILVLSLVGLLLAGTVARSMTRIYEAKVVMLPAESDNNSGLSAIASQFGGLASLAGVSIPGGGTDSVKESIAVLKSRRFTAAFIESEGLKAIMFETDVEHESGTDQFGSTIEQDDQYPTDEQAFIAFDGVRLINQDKRSGVITLTIHWKSPALAAEWANKLVAKINAVMRKRAINHAQKSIEYLQQQLNQTNIVELQEVIFRLIEAQMKSIMIANVREEYAFKVIDPAFVPDSDHYIKPKEMLMMILGLILGGMIGLLFVFVLIKD